MSSAGDAPLDRDGAPRHSEQTVWDDEILEQAAELYSTGVSFADVADTDSDGQASPCDPDEAGPLVFPPNKAALSVVDHERSIGSGWPPARSVNLAQSHCC